MHRPEVQRVVHLVLGQDQIARQVLLVVLEHDGQLPDVDTLAEQIVLEILQALEIVVEAPRLTVSDEHDPVRSLQHELPRGVVVALPRNRIELKLRAEAGNVAQLQGGEVEEEGSVGLGRERNHPATAGFGHPAVDVLQVGRLPGPARPIVDDLAGDFTRGEVDE